MPQDRVFLDSNVLFSAAYGSKGLLQLWQLAQQGRCLLLTSPYAVEEAKRNLSEPSHLNRLQELLQDVQIVPEVDPSMPCPVDLPEKDRPLLLAAISAGADYFLTGDITHFGRFFGQRVGGVKICRPKDYLLTRNR